jgi:uncharacterized membrane protein
VSVATHPNRARQRRAADAGSPELCGSMEILISRVLRAGVIVAAALIAAGALLFLIQGPGPGDPTSLAQLDSRSSLPFSVSPRTIWQGVTHLRAAAVIELGLLVLILTPVARVGMTVVLFAKQRDRTFVAITTVVLLVLLVGLLDFAR